MMGAVMMMVIMMMTIMMIKKVLWILWIPHASQTFIYYVSLNIDVRSITCVCVCTFLSVTWLFIGEQEDILRTTVTLEFVSL